MGKNMCMLYIRAVKRLSDWNLLSSCKENFGREKNKQKHWSL